MSSSLKNLQQAVVRQLREQSALTGITVVARRAVDLESQLEAAVQSALGLSVIVLDPCPRRVEPAAPGPVYVEIAVTVRVIENLLINEAWSGLLITAERASQTLHLWPLPAPWADSVMRLTEHNPWTTPTSPIRGAVALDLHFLATNSIATTGAR